MKQTLFYEDEYYLLSNFSAHQVEFGGKLYPTVEHAYQSQKFTDKKLQEKVSLAKSPFLAKEIAYQFKSKWRRDWHKVKVKAMEKIIRAKWKQHIEVRESLKKTGKTKIIENSPIDYFWGIGKDGTGKNMMGKIWMKLRDEIS